MIPFFKISQIRLRLKRIDIEKMYPKKVYFVKKIEDEEGISIVIPINRKEIIISVYRLFWRKESLEVFAQRD